MSVVGLIPARGGSKRIPRKNLALCAGKPLLAWAAEAALASRRLDRVILSTDDEEIAEAGRDLGLEVPFLRPTQFADDRAPMIPVMQHMLRWLAERGETVEAQVLLQPTSPMRRARHIDEAVELLFESGAETVVSVTEIAHTHHPVVTYRIAQGRLEPYFEDVLPPYGVDPEPAYARNGPAILANRPAVIERGERFGSPLVPYIMPPEVSVDIDTPLDLAIAEALLARQAGTSDEAPAA